MLGISDNEEALRQITVIDDYLAQDSPGNARRWIVRLRAAVDTLRNFPERHAILYTVAEASLI